MGDFFDGRHAAPGGDVDFTPRVAAAAYFDGGADYMSLSLGTPNDQSKFIAAFWLRRGRFATEEYFFQGGTSASADSFYMGFLSGDTLSLTNGSASARLTTNRLFRDTEWFHVVFSYDSDDGTAGDRMRLWINGIEETSFANDDNPSSGQHVNMNGSGQTHTIGAYQTAPAGFMHCAMAQVTLLDGVSIQNADHAITDFGEFVTVGTNGSVWAAKADAAVVALADSAGGNSFCLTSAIGDGTDASTNSNDFTPTSMSHAANGQIDTPSNPGQRWDPALDPVGTTTQAGRVSTMTGGSATGIHTGVLGACSGKLQIEFELSGTFMAANGALVGIIAQPQHTTAVNPATAELRQFLYSSTGAYYDATDDSVATRGESPNTFAPGDRIMMRVNFDDNEISFFKNGTLEDTMTPAGNLSDALYTICHGDQTSGSVTQICTLNVHEADLQDALGSGFTTWTQAGVTPVGQGVDHFQALPYTGDGTAIGSGGNAVTGAGFRPDLVWIKNRDEADAHRIIDSSRGAQKEIFPNSSDNESTETESLDTFDADGFTVGDKAEVNTSAEAYIAWLWKLNGGTTAANSDGSISSTVQVAAPGHMSIVQWTGTGANGTVGHGLAKAPGFVVAKNRTDDSTDFFVWGLGVIGTNVLFLSLTNVETTSATAWNSTIPSPSVLSLGSNGSSNGSGDDMVAFCFTPTQGVCAMGTYIGNGSTTGPLISTGFAPRWVMVKRRAGGTSSWAIWDLGREIANDGEIQNPVDDYLLANEPNAETSPSAIDLLATGFRPRNSGAGVNLSAAEYLWLAMADVAGGPNLPPMLGR